MMKRVQVWDIWIRITHWLLVLFFTLSYFTGENSDIVHSFAGYALFALVIFRVVWGFIGGTYARFVNFMYGPIETHEYTLSLMKGVPKHYYGHNPLAALMVFALLGSLIATSFTGLKAQESLSEVASNQANIEKIILEKAKEEDNTTHEKHYGIHKKDDHDTYWEALHELFANFSLFLVAVHILGVIISSTVHRESIMGSMVDGKKEPPHNDH